MPMHRLLSTCVRAALAAALVVGHAAAQGAPPAAEPRGPLTLFLLVGQSNMAGRGTVEEIDRTPVDRVWMLTKDLVWVPAVEPLHFDKPKVAGVGPGRAFGVAIAKAMPTAEIGLVPAAVGGSSIRAWLPGAADSATSTHPYDDAIARAQAALRRGTLAGILWLQGESDGNARNAASYEGSMRAVIANFRRDLNAPDVPFLIGQMGRFEERPWNAYRLHVDSVHRAVVASTPRTAFVTTGGLKHRGDTVHYDAPSAREIGRRYAESYVRLFPAPPSKP